MTTQTSPAALTVENLVIEIGNYRIVDGVNFRADPGQVIGILGPNGSGKSTMLRSIFHARKPTAGTIRVNGVDVWTRDTRWSSRQMAVVLQESPASFPLTCAEIVQMGRSPHKQSWRGINAADQKLCQTALCYLEVDQLANVSFAHLSGGERQRVLIARALAQQTGLLIMDEPTNHLDIHHQIKVMDLTRRLNATILVALHDINLAARFCDTIVLLSAGRLVASGPPDEVLIPALLDDIYQIKTSIIRHPTGSPNVIVL